MLRVHGSVPLTLSRAARSNLGLQIKKHTHVWGSGTNCFKTILIINIISWKESMVHNLDGLLKTFSAVDISDSDISRAQQAHRQLRNSQPQNLE